MAAKKEAMSDGVFYFWLATWVFIAMLVMIIAGIWFFYM